MAIGEQAIMKGDAPVHSQQSPFRKIADTLAIVFHPVFISTAILLIAIAGYHTHALPQALYSVMAVLLFVLFVPIFTVHLQGRDYYMRDKRKRRLPLAVSFFSNVALLVVLHLLLPKGGRPHLLVTFFALNLAVLFFINLFFRISLHGNAIGVAIYYMVSAFHLMLNEKLYSEFLWLLPAALAVIACFIIVLMQRLYTHSHNRFEVFAGLASGVLAVQLDVTFHISQQITLWIQG